MSVFPTCLHNDELQFDHIGIPYYFHSFRSSRPSTSSPNRWKLLFLITPPDSLTIRHVGSRLPRLPCTVAVFSHPVSPLSWFPRSAGSSSRLHLLFCRRLRCCVGRVVTVLTFGLASDKFLSPCQVAFMCSPTTWEPNLTSHMKTRIVNCTSTVTWLASHG